MVACCTGQSEHQRTTMPCSEIWRTYMLGHSHGEWASMQPTVMWWPSQTRNNRRHSYSRSAGVPCLRFPLLREYLQWESPITGITAKANRTLRFLRRNLRYCLKQLRERAYHSLVRSRLEYAPIEWDPYLAKDITKLDNVQRPAARLVANDHRRTSSVTTMLDTLGGDIFRPDDRRAGSGTWTKSLAAGWQWWLMIIWNKASLEPDQSTVIK